MKTAYHLRAAAGVSPGEPTSVRKGGPLGPDDWGESDTLSEMEMTKSSSSSESAIGVHWQGVGGGGNVDVGARLWGLRC